MQRHLGPKPRITRGGHQVYSSPAHFKMMNDLPYGIWTCEDGREVLFNRFYEPIWGCAQGAAPAEANPNEWVPWQKQEYFYDDSTKTKRANATRALAVWMRRHGQ